MAGGQQVSRQGSGAAYVTAQLLFEFTAYVLTCEIVTERGVKMSEWSMGDRQTDRGRMCEKAKCLL